MRRVLDDLFRCRVEGGFDHRRFDERTDPRGLAALEPDQRREGSAHAREGIAWPTRYAWLVALMAGDPREPGHLFHRLCEANVVPPRTVEAEGGHPDHDCPRVEVADRFPGYAELIEDSGREVLDEYVGQLEQAPEDLASTRRSEVEGQVFLVRVDAQVDRRPLPPGRAIDEGPTSHSHPVRVLNGLDVNDFGAERREHVGGCGARPPCRRVEDPDPLEGKRW